eukprot:9103211-Alexandrium_andersonii.AAC.1
MSSISLGPPRTRGSRCRGPRWCGTTRAVWRRAASPTGSPRSSRRSGRHWNRPRRRPQSRPQRGEPATPQCAGAT